MAIKCRSCISLYRPIILCRGNRNYKYITRSGYVSVASNNSRSPQNSRRYLDSVTLKYLGSISRIYNLNVPTTFLNHRMASLHSSEAVNGNCVTNELTLPQIPRVLPSGDCHESQDSSVVFQNGTNKSK